MFNGEIFQFCIRAQFFMHISFIFWIVVVMTPPQHQLRQRPFILQINSIASLACWTFCKFSIDDDPERWWSSLNSLILDPLCLLTTKVVNFWRFINLCICNGISSNFVSIISRWLKLTNLHILVGSLVRNLNLDINKVCKLY